MELELQTIRLATVSLGILLSLGNAVLAQIRNFRSASYRAFSIGMVCLIAETILRWMSAKAATPMQVVALGKWGLTCMAFIPGFWLIFSLCYARENYVEFLKTWRGTILGAFVIPILLVGVARNDLFVDNEVVLWQGSWIMHLGWSGYLLFTCQLLISVLILVNLERTLITSYGRLRRQIKFSILA